MKSWLDHEPHFFQIETTIPIKVEPSYFALDKEIRFRTVGQQINSDDELTD